ncbi:hypothetical protein ACTWQB_02375 [Piscibacillus sp. B03]|uniref:hypothetical protein n=1 Tax=Piscibacillus sp. B03 TaxID=3457430 RepID=UPI003FCC9901
MDEHKKVRVTVNQENQSNKKHDLEYYLTPKNKKSQSSILGFHSRSNLSKMMKPVLLAVLLGVLFGAGLIYYFSDLTPDALPATTTEVDEEEEPSSEPNNNEQQSGETLSKPGQVYEVVQFGLFSSKENADELISDSLQPNAVPATVQEQNGQFYVISHLISSESEKDAITDWLESNDLVYMENFFYKSWSFDAVNVDVNESNLEWLNEGITLIEKGESGDQNWESDLQTWFSQQPPDYEQSAKLQEISELLTKLGDSSDLTQQSFIKNTIILNMHLFYSNLA